MSRVDGAPERALAIKLAGTAERRAAEATELERMAGSVDYEVLTALIGGARLLPLLGSRLVAAAPDAVPDSFREVLDATTSRARRRASLVAQVTLLLTRTLDGAGIPVVALKGPHLAERLYGDAGMRISNDIDLLVAPEHFHTAAGVLGRLGYRSVRARRWVGDLPLFEGSLRASEDWKPPVDLHWRLHWYDEPFSRDFVLRSAPDTQGMLTPEPLDEFAALSLFWCRDGLSGLRHAADIAAHWDRYGNDLPACALDELSASYPPLRQAFAVAAVAAAEAVGVPATRLLADPGAQRRSVRMALGLSSLLEPTSRAQAEARIVLLDALLTPRRPRLDVVSRHLAPPAPVIADIYGLPPRARYRRAVRRAYYAVRRGATLARGSAQLLVGARRDRRSRSALGSR